MRSPENTGRIGSTGMDNVGEEKTVLVVDDAPANLQIVNSILKDDYKIRVATSGAKALVLVKVKPLPDLILLDVVMPEMDGYEVCGILKATPEANDIPVIFLTGQTETDDETKAFQVFNNMPCGIPEQNCQKYQFPSFIRCQCRIDLRQHRSRREDGIPRH